MSVALPKELLSSLVGLPGFDETAFLAVHNSGEQITSIRINPNKIDESRIPDLGSRISHPASRVPWSAFGYYLKVRPSFTFDPLFHAGCYYVQEASSMFLELALKNTVDLSKPLRVLDLSAAPGGKSTHIQSLISSNSLLVSNEVIRSRANILKDNIIKWGSENVVVTNNDPRDFTKLENFFDVIVVDAPCSGSGLFRRDPEAIHEWSENNVQLCAQRQQRILADVWPTLKKDGVLIYSTCSYSKEEDEGIAEWMKNFKIANCGLPIDASWGITESNGGYRFWPHKSRGEGFFIAAFKKLEGESENSMKLKRNVTTLSKNETKIVQDWMDLNDITLVKNENTAYAWPTSLEAEMNFLLGNLRVIYSGIRVGDLVRDKLVPDHALALSGRFNRNLMRISMNREQAIAYLQRKDIKLDVKQKGWHLMEFEGHSLGWINALRNRINNYYPKELRIIKDN
jgi:16S rRNA C967 or C1407 C5-methylase (RsmB/RsmF family)/NOL1/NOP2/fmu family ribosome biogenesis protein